MNQTEEPTYHPFHLSIPVNDLKKAKEFYGDILGLPQGRTDPAKWIDYNFFGSQVVCHFATSTYNPKTIMAGNFPIPNFGVNLTKDQMTEVQGKLSKANIKYDMIVLEGKGEVMYLKDFTGNNLLFYPK